MGKQDVGPIQIAVTPQQKAELDNARSDILQYFGLGASLVLLSSSGEAAVQLTDIAG